MTPPIPSSIETKPTWIRASLVFAAVAAGILSYFLMPAEMEEGARRMAGIFTTAVILWATEAIPLFATSLVVIGLQAWLIAIQPDIGGDLTYQMVFGSLSEPVIILFLGGFILARSIQQEKIDVQMAGLLLRAFGHHPYRLLAGIMIITAVFSMWMSNTATTAMMIVLVQPFIARIPDRDRFRKAIILSVPFAANIGGIGTPIGTPPNAIVISQLSARGMEITFLEWMMFGIPLVLLALLVTWVVLLVAFHPSKERFTFEVYNDFVLTRKAGIVYATFVVTVLLWLTGNWTGIPAPVVAVLPAAVLTVTQVINKNDFNRLEWNVLVLIAGGIALGHGIVQTGLDDWIVRLIPVEGMTFFMLAAFIGVAVVLLSTVISNTVAVNILLPIALAAALAINATSVQLQVLAVMCAVMSNFAMSLPISTPPNAIAYSTGQISVKDMIRVGGLMTVGATIIIILTGPTVVGFFLR